MWSSKWLENPFSKRSADQSDVDVGPYSVFIAATVLATLAVMSNTVLVAQTSKEWSQCSGSEGPIADVIISGYSAVIQAGQDRAFRRAVVSRCDRAPKAWAT